MTGNSITSDDILNSVSDAIITTNTQFTILSWNRAAEMIYGWSADDVIGKPIDVVLSTVYRDVTREAVLDNVATDGVWKGDVIQRCKDGRRVQIMSSISQWRDGADRPVGMIVVNRDVTAHGNQPALASQHPNAFYEKVVQSLSEGVLVIAGNGEIEYMNPVAAEMFGYTASEVIGRHWGYVIPADQHGLMNAVIVHPDPVEPSGHALILNRDDGSYSTFLVHSRLRINDQLDSGSVITFTDITQLAKMPQTEGEARMLLESTLNALSAHIAILDETGTIIAVNKAWRQFADKNGLNDPMYSVGTNYLALCDSVTGPDAEDASIVAGGLRNLMYEGDNRFYLEYECHSPTEQFWFMMHMDSFQVGGNRRIVVAHHDITGRKRAEQKEHDQRLLADVLSGIAATINRSLDVDITLEYIVNAIQYVVPHTGANLIFVDTENGIATMVQFCKCYADHGRPVPEIGEVISLNDYPLYKSLIATPRPIAIPDVTEVPDWVTRPDTEWVRSYASAPIRVEDKVIGFINVDSDTLGTFEYTQAIRLQTIADQAAIAIRNAQLYQELGNYSEFLEQAVIKRTEQLLQSTQHIESILNSSSDVIMLVQRDGTIQQANPTFDQWFGNRNGEVFGIRLTEIVASEHAEYLMQTLDSVFEGQEPQRIEIVAQHEDGTLFDTDTAIFPVKRHQGEMTSVVCSMRDITERKRTEQTLRQALEREIEISNMRMRFLSMASHDLRNPLAVIRSGVDMLADYYDRLSEEKKAKKFHQIRTSIAHMVELLDDVLTIGRVEAGKLTFTPELVDLEMFCRHLLSEIQTTIGANHIFNFVITGESEPRISDPKLLRHILFNLLSNAVKYSSMNSEVTLELNYNADETVFRIRDHGIGIPEADLPRLFEPFHRANNVGVRSGTGLGLAIVQQSVRLHGGSLRYDTQESVGTTFTVILPTQIEESE